MRPLFTSLLFASLLTPALPQGKQEKKKLKPPVIEITECKVGRTPNGIGIELTYKNSGEMPTHNGAIVVEFRGTNQRIVGTRVLRFETDPFEPNAEESQNAETNDDPRAVSVTFSAKDVSRGELDVKNAGPFPIQ